MKWILAILLFVSATAIGQSDDTDKYIWYKFQYGSRMPRFWADSVLKAAGLVKFTGLAASTDTTTYKPIAINSAGNVVKFGSWQGSGSGATTFAALTDVTITSPKNGNIPVYDSITSKWINRRPVYFNVKDYGAVGDSTTDDRAAIMKARDAAYTAGGVLFFPAGKYRISDSILFQYPIRIQGVGKSGGLHNNQAGGVLEKNRLGPIQTSSEIIVTDGKNGFVFERQSDETKATPAIEYLTMSSTVAPGSATGGAFIVVRQMIQGFSAINCTFYGGYIQINIESGYYQYIAGCHFSAPQKAGLKTANNIRTDTGDFTVTGCVFSSGTFSTLADTTRAIWWTSGGGMRIVNNKFDACEFDTTHAFRYDIYATNILDPTSVFIISDNSIENYTVSGIYLHGVVSPYVRLIQINNNEFTPVGSTGPAIDIDQMEDVSISEFLVRDWSAHTGVAVKVTNTNKVRIGKGSVTNFSSNIDLTGSTNTHTDYMWGGDVAIGTLNTTNVAGLNATLYTTETILGRSASGLFGAGVLEVASNLPDANSADVGYVNFSAVSNPGRVAAMGAITDGTTAGDRGGKLSFYTKLDGSPSFPERMSINNTGNVAIQIMDSVGTPTGGCVFRDAATKELRLAPCGSGSSQWTTVGSDVHYTPGNVVATRSTTGNNSFTVANTSNGVAARALYIVENDQGFLGQFGSMSSTHATLPNFLLFEAIKDFQIGTDQGVASGGTSVINFVTGGYSVAPALQIKGTGTVYINTTTDNSSGAKLQVNGDATVTDEAYDATTWNASLEVPTKNAVRDKIESLPRTLDALFTTAGNTGTSETDLYSYTVPANTLSADGRTVNFEIDGEFNDNTATATVKLYFAGNVTLNTGAVNISTALTAWRIKGYIMRTSSTTAHVTYEMHCPGLATTVFLGYNNLTSLDFTTTNIFKVTAQAGGAGGGNSDITAHSWQLLYKPQP